MARMVAKDVDFHGCPMKKDDWVLLPFPAANRDPEAFERADEVVIDRLENRHAAFGLGIHRCLGSNLARLELRVAVEEFLASASPTFELADPTATTSSGASGRSAAPGCCRSASSAERTSVRDGRGSRRGVRRPPRVRSRGLAGRLVVSTTAVPSGRTAATMVPDIVDVPCWRAVVAAYSNPATDRNRALGAPSRVIGELVSSSSSGRTSS